MSAQFCGCDPECKPQPHYCERHAHQLIQNLQGRDVSGPPYATELALPPSATPSTYAPIPGVLVIGLGHKARNGKDSVARFMIERAPADVLRIGFADALYDHCRVVHGMKAKDATLLQRVGVDMRKSNPTVWIDAVYWKIYDKRPKVVVIPDTRFPNEAEFVKQMGGQTLKVVRSDLAGKPFQVTDRDPNHISETALNDWQWDLTLYNYQGLDELRLKAQYTLGYIRGLR
jgi:hypothetical protein